MENRMRELLQQSYKGDEVIEYIEKLEIELNKADRINDKYMKALDKLDSKIIEILSTADGLYDCKGVCDKGDTPCVSQCMQKGYWKELSFRNE